MKQFTSLFFIILFLVNGNFCFADPVPDGSSYPGTDIPLELGAWHQAAVGAGLYGDQLHIDMGGAITGYVMIDMAKTKLSIGGTLMVGQGDGPAAGGVGGYADGAISFRKLWPLLKARSGTYSRLWLAVGANVAASGTLNTTLDPWFLRVQPVVALEVPFVINGCVIKYDFLRAGLGLYDGMDPSYRHAQNSSSTGQAGGAMSSDVNPPATTMSHFWPVLRPSVGTELFAKCKNGFETQTDLQYIIRSFGPEDAASLNLKLAYDHPLHDVPYLDALGFYVQANVVAQGKLFSEMTALLNNRLMKTGFVGISLRFNREVW